MNLNKKIEEPELFSEKQPLVFLRAEYNFPSTFSYKDPRATSQLAFGPFIPSPSTFKLALVNAALKLYGYKYEVMTSTFDLVKDLKVYIMPAKHVSQFSAKIRILKKRERYILQSIATRQYYIFDDNLVIYIQVPEEKKERMAELMYNVEYLGTADSICWCVRVTEEEPDVSLCVTEEPLETRSNVPVYLTDFAEDVTYEDFDPYGKKKSKSKILKKKVYFAPPYKKRYVEGGCAIFERML